MSITVTGTPPPGPARRVRHQAREAVAVMVFSASTSVLLTTVAFVVLHLGKQG